MSKCSYLPRWSYHHHFDNNSPLTNHYSCSFLLYCTVPLKYSGSYNFHAPSWSMFLLSFTVSLRKSGGMEEDSTSKYNIDVTPHFQIELNIFSIKSQDWTWVLVSNETMDKNVKYEPSIQQKRGAHMGSIHILSYEILLWFLLLPFTHLAIPAWNATCHSKSEILISWLASFRHLEQGYDQWRICTQRKRKQYMIHP